MKKYIILTLFLFLSSVSLLNANDYSGCKTEYVDKKIKVESCKSRGDRYYREHSVLFFTNLTQEQMRVKFRCKVWYNCSDYNNPLFVSNKEYETWTETIYLKPEEESLYTPTKDFEKTCHCPTYLKEFELIEYSTKPLPNKEVAW